MPTAENTYPANNSKIKEMLSGLVPGFVAPRKFAAHCRRVCIQLPHYKSGGAKYKKEQPV